MRPILVIAYWFKSRKNSKRKEHYMEKLTEEYVKLLTSPGHASDHFWEYKSGY